jgi:hypothetical protein
MSDVDWGSEGKELPKPKKRVPLWVWICGGGCLLAVIALVAVIVFVASKASHMMNQDEQWAKLAKVLPFDEKPQDVMIVGTGEFASMAPGIDDMWQIQNKSGRWQAQILKFSGSKAAEQRKGLATGDLGDDARARLGPFGIFELEHGQVDVQGRSLPWVRFQLFEKEAGDPAAEDKQDKADEKPGFMDAMKMATKQRILMLDITPDSGSGALILQYIELGKGGPVETSDVVEFLTPFQIGPKHEVK